MKKLALAVTAAAFAAATFGMTATPAPAAEVVMKIGTATLNDMQHEWMKRFQAMVNKDGAGKIRVEIYPASQLGSIPREIEATQFGSIQAWVGPPEFLSGVDPRFEVLSAPSLFKDIAHADRTLHDKQFSDAFLALGADKGLKGLGLFVHGPSAFDTRKEVKSPDDLKGMKIRVLAAQLQTEQISRLGGSPVPMPLDQVLPALQQGAIDGAFTDLPIFASLKYADAAKYVYITNESMVTSVVELSKQWFDAQTPDVQKIILTDGEKVSVGMLPFVVQFNADQAKVWTSSGGQIIEASADQRKAMTAKYASIPDDVLKDKPTVRALYDILAAAAKRTAK